ncbi:hypothetical protein F4809DRAFT_75968 [Biscogniauxia mediterranea]|nr:hypothetical protein F4809DRAFT_75968 [Biscogniauxia mediterranea]
MVRAFNKQSGNFSILSCSCLLFIFFSLSLNLFLIPFYPSSSHLKKNPPKYSGNIGFPFFLTFFLFFPPLPSWISTLLREPHYWVPFCIHQPCSAARNKPSVIQDRVLSLDPPIPHPPSPFSPTLGTLRPDPPKNSFLQALKKDKDRHRRRGIRKIRK